MLEKLLLAIGLTLSLSVFTKINTPSQKHTNQYLESANHHFISSWEAEKSLSY
jgi:tRNA A37 N6-isopentenylltransferase MiaA